MTQFNNFINKAADNVWDWFSRNQYEDNGYGELNKVGQFSDWVDDLDNESLAEIAGVDCNYNNGLFISLLRGAISRGISQCF